MNARSILGGLVDPARLRLARAVTDDTCRQIAARNRVAVQYSVHLPRADYSRHSSGMLGRQTVPALGRYGIAEIEALREVYLLTALE